MSIGLIHRRLAHITIERGFYSFMAGPLWMFLARLDPGEGWALYGSFKRRHFAWFFGGKKYDLRWVL